jgi:hypothetical protein
MRNVQAAQCDPIALLHSIRNGRKAQKSLEALFDLPESIKKNLRLTWLAGLDAATYEIGWERQGRIDEVAFSRPVVAWFERSTSDLVRRFLLALAKPPVPDPRLLELLSAVQTGRQAEESFAAILRTGLRERVPQLANLLSPDHSESDVVQETVSLVIEWAVEEFEGTTEAELWSIAHQRLTWRSIDRGRRQQPLPITDAAALLSRERLLFRLHHAEGLSYPKLAELLGCASSPDALGYRVRALRAELHDRLRGG